MNHFSKLLTLGALALGVSLSSCEKEESTNPDNAVNKQTFVFEDAKNGDVIPGQYIVVLKENSSVAKKSTTFSNYEASQEAMRDYASSLLSSKKSSQSAVQRVYSSAIQGFSVKMDAATLESLETNPDVAYIQQDRVVRLQENAAVANLSTIVSKKAAHVPWGVARVRGGQAYRGSAKLWVIDTGIDLDHPDLNVDKNLSAGLYGRGGDDDNGHGTHCAGSAAAFGNIVGVASGATVVAVKILNSRGGGSVSGIIAGVDYVRAKASRGDVANMSLGIPRTDPDANALDAAVKRLANAGVKVAVAAGNESQNTYYVSPARINGSRIYTVSSYAEGDRWSSFSNYGTSVDYCGPGSDVLSTYLNGRYATLSGTSMATPHIAGILLWGSIKTNGYVKGDPDGNADRIATR